MHRSGLCRHSRMSGEYERITRHRSQPMNEERQSAGSTGRYVVFWLLRDMASRINAPASPSKNVTPEDVRRGV
jgi:hypothetical protein